MTDNGPSPSSAMLSILLDEVPDDDRRTVDLRWADRMLRTPRRGLIATLALRGVDHRYPVEMLRLREAIRSGRKMTAQEARLRLVERQLGIQGGDDAGDVEEALVCLQRWIGETTEETMHGNSDGNDPHRLRSSQ
jgi:hypothetical protein